MRYSSGNDFKTNRIKIVWALCATSADKAIYLFILCIHVYQKCCNKTCLEARQIGTVILIKFFNNKGRFHQSLTVRLNLSVK